LIPAWDLLTCRTFEALALRLGGGFAGIAASVAELARRAALQGARLAFHPGFTILRNDVDHVEGVAVNTSAKIPSGRC
jgi:hypothetical protein